MPRRRTSRLLGLPGHAWLCSLGLALGLLFAPVPGRELRAQLRALLGRAAPGRDAELAERVGFELEHAPRTWHLPAAAGGGGRGPGGPQRRRSPTTAARDELARVAAAVPGVAGVDNLVEVETDAGSADPGRGPA